MTDHLQAIRTLAEAYADIARAWQLVEVLDNGEWSATGPAYLTVRLAGTARRVVLATPSARPAIGDFVQVQRADSDTGAYWLALPLPTLIVRPQTCTDSIYYLVGRSVTTGDYRILRFASLAGIGETWTDIAACPAAASGDEEPQMFWLLASHEYAFPSHGLPDGVSSLDHAQQFHRFFCYTRGGELSYSDDLGATWTGTGFSPAYVAEYSDYARMYACDAGAIYESVDYGATWAAIPDSGPPAGDWIYVAAPDAKLLFDAGGNADDFDGGTQTLRAGNTWPNHAYRGTIWGVTTAGAWVTINSFAGYVYPDDDADPAFDSTDKGGAGILGKRSWTDPGSDQGDYTVLTTTPTIPPLPATWGDPFITTHERRDRYGVYGGPTDADHAFSSVGKTLMIGDTLYQLDENTFADASDLTYDEGTPKTLTDYGVFDYGEGVTRYNEGSTSHTSYMQQQRSPEGGIAWFGNSLNAFWVNDTSHPFLLTGLDIIDFAQCGSGIFPFFNNCYFVAIDDETEAADHCSFAAQSALEPDSSTPWGGGSINTARYLSAVTTMRADLGDYYVGTRNSICAYSPTLD